MKIKSFPFVFSLSIEIFIGKMQKKRLERRRGNTIIEGEKERKERKRERDKDKERTKKEKEKKRKKERKKERKKKAEERGMMIYGLFPLCWQQAHCCCFPKANFQMALVRTYRVFQN